MLWLDYIQYLTGLDLSFEHLALQTAAATAARRMISLFCAVLSELPEYQVAKSGIYLQ